MPPSVATAPQTEKPEAGKGVGNKLMAWWQALENYLRAVPQRLIMVISLTAVGLIGWLDNITPWEVNFALAYAAIIVLTAWLCGGEKGLLVALVCAVVAFWVNLPSNPYQTVTGQLLSNMGRVVFFVWMAISIGAIRKQQEADASRIQMLEEMRQLEMEIVNVSEHEQQRIGQDLHDGLCQQLAAISCAARALADDLQAAAQPAASDAVLIEKALSQTVLEARSLARGIFPVHVDATGLSAALGEMVETTQRLTGMNIAWTETADSTVNDPEVAMHLYRIAQEAVANAVRHSGASQVIVSLLAHANAIELRVDDNGKGIPALGGSVADGMGLRTMRYRARSMGANLDIQSRAGGGTSLCCKLSNEPSKTHSNGQN